jgi:hypothetical protein
LSKSILDSGGETVVYACKIKKATDGSRCSSGRQTGQTFKVVAQRRVTQHVPIDESTGAAEDGEDEAERKANESPKKTLASSFTSPRLFSLGSEGAEHAQLTNVIFSIQCDRDLGQGLVFGLAESRRDFLLLSCGEETIALGDCTTLNRGNEVTINGALCEIASACNLLNRLAPAKAPQRLRLAVI